jgi:hypothetical protein
MGARSGREFLAGLSKPREIWVGGSRDSGIGRAGGTWSFDFFCDPKNIGVLKGSLSPIDYIVLP